ncbi:HAD domain-containing protein [Oscillatoria sp. FACHB-1406]|uniref:HAD domain-containing protein n=1 Tax=Oscillatoria sp. FACHB-1406 TaxID=2692846 RepID=UPI0016838DA2|nr:HAD domain-containing protein [Oscillatoria sp. FACHB-1406]MBD2580471.1 hypothetical protein [Oscillatoria sp. FACHB-1406]
MTTWIFLDIDGVLVPEKTFDVSRSQENRLQFDSACLQRFEGVLEHYPEVLIVISSSWREIFSFEFTRSLFSPNLADRVVGFTPFLPPQLIHKLQYLRHQEVLEFLQQARAENDFWVAIDDIREHYPPSARVVVTDANEGFDEGAALSLKLYLSTDLENQSLE